MFCFVANTIEILGCDRCASTSLCNVLVAWKAIENSVHTAGINVILSNCFCDVRSIRCKKIVLFQIGKISLLNSGCIWETYTCKYINFLICGKRQCRILIKGSEIGNRKLNFNANLISCDIIDGFLYFLRVCRSTRPGREAYDDFSTSPLPFSAVLDAVLLSLESVFPESELPPLLPHAAMEHAIMDAMKIAATFFSFFRPRFLSFCLAALFRF